VNPTPKSPKHRFCINTRIKLIAFKYSKHNFCHESTCMANINPLIKSKSKHMVQNVCSVSFLVYCTAVLLCFCHGRINVSLYRHRHTRKSVKSRVHKLPCILNRCHSRPWHWHLHPQRTVPHRDLQVHLTSLRKY